MMLRPNRQFTPPTDVIELIDKLLVMVEIAGMRSGDFNIVLQNRRLTITGTRQRPGAEVAAFHQVEIGFGEFRIDLNLPWAADREAVSATYEHGFLTIELPRKPIEKVRVVDLEAQEQESTLS
ncbi:MAG: Hsp20/alpha crystallin family protein [Anaerolineae bacterium]|nr:Hsp20/alpha crystallin family protein [Anaerolineae bacterium]